MPPGVTQLNYQKVGWGGFSNGQIDRGAMTCQDPVPSCLQPQAFEAFNKLVVAAKAAGYNLTGGGYRSIADEEARTKGKSIHGWGLAVDVNINGSIIGSFDTPVYLWMCQNAGTYGYGNPDWAKPAGNTCQGIPGKGTGGSTQSGQTGVLEPWHWEWFSAQAGR